MNKKEKILTHVPSYFSPKSNLYWRTLLESHGEEDEKIVQQIDQAKQQIFVITAEKVYLDSLGENVAVFRPLELNLSDEKYRRLIPLLSFYPKQVKSLITKILDVFYHETFSRFNIQTTSLAPFNLSGGECLVFKKENDGVVGVTKSFTADGNSDGPGTIRVASTSGMYVGQQVSVSDDDTKTFTATVIGLTGTVVTTDQDMSGLTLVQNPIVFFDTYQYVVFQASDFETPGSATTSEVAEAINVVAKGITAESTSSDTVVSLRTETVGRKGEIQVLGGTANDVLNFPVVIGRTLRVEVTEINPNEIVIRIPATIPALRRQLSGCLHYHPNAVIVPGWPSSYVYNPLFGDYTVKGTSTTLNQSILAGQVYTQLLVIDASSFPNEPGLLMLNFGKNGMEYPVPYIGRPNNSTLLIDPGYVFTNSHSVGESINTMIYSATVPRQNGGDYPVYTVGIEGARLQVQEIVRSIVATGVVIRWEVDYPVCGKVS